MLYVPPVVGDRPGPADALFEALAIAAPGTPRIMRCSRRGPLIVATNVALACSPSGLPWRWSGCCGPADRRRVVATDLFLTFLVMGAGVLSVRSGEGAYLEVMLVVAVVGFLGTAMVARFIERRGA